MAGLAPRAGAVVTVLDERERELAGLDVAEDHAEGRHGVAGAEDRDPDGRRARRAVRPTDVAVDLGDVEKLGALHVQVADDLADGAGQL